MLDLSVTTKFKKDLKMCAKQHKDLDLLKKVVDTLRIPQPLPPHYKDHNLHGNYEGTRECHLDGYKGDWLLIYRVPKDENLLILERTGSHSDLFR